MKSFGITVTVGGTAIGKLTDSPISGRDVNIIDITTKSSAGNSKEFVGGLIDNGTIELTGTYDIADAGQAALIGWTAQTKAVVVSFSDGSTATFDAVVGTLNLNGPLDDKVEFTCSLKITGPVTISD
jgi:predicted secreted protein